MRTLTIPLLMTFAAVAIFGMFLVSDHMGHEAGCPFMPQGSALCTDTLLTHITHWHTAFAATAAEVALFCTCVLLAFRFDLSRPPGASSGALVTRMHESDVPTLFQMLFREGILHPKVP